MVWDLCSMDSSNITKEFSEKRKRKIPLGTKGRTSILSVESSASCGASFPVRRGKLPDRECFDTSFRQGSYTPLRRLCVYPLWTCRPQTAYNAVRRQQVKTQRKVMLRKCKLEVVVTESVLCYNEITKSKEDLI